MLDEGSSELVCADYRLFKHTQFRVNSLVYPASQLFKISFFIIEIMLMIALLSIITIDSAVFSSKSVDYRWLLRGRIQGKKPDLLQYRLRLSSVNLI
ncbi:MAG: hypothetical protein B6D71_11600 [gamma proteobacterium symbiont of Stewartia floridana]|nr:MAG: hypothetical protein B6D71_11600 [gamma proteobacterium symbiont of Stewartia floridana]